MHNTRIYSHSFYLVIGTVFGVSLTCLALLVFLQYHMYLFIGGLAPFARGGNLTGGEECFDLYDCAAKLCVLNASSFFSTTEGCNDTMDAYMERLPAWMAPEYEKFSVIFWRSIAMIAVTAVAYYLFPFCCFALWKMAYSPFVIRNFSRAFDVLLVVISFATSFLMKTALDQLNVFRPNLAWWLEDLIELSGKLLLVLIFGEVIILAGGIIYNNYVQVHPDIIAFDPLNGDDDDIMTWRTEARDHRD